MSVIKGCLKDDSKELKKLVMMYWEVVKKYDAEGKLLPEMILVRTSTDRSGVPPAQVFFFARRKLRFSVASILPLSGIFGAKFVLDEAEINGVPGGVTAALLPECCGYALSRDEMGPMSCKPMPHDDPGSFSFSFVCVSCRDGDQTRTRNPPVLMHTSQDSSTLCWQNSGPNAPTTG